MNSERWARVAALVDELLDLPEAGRTARLAQIATADPDLARDIDPFLAEGEDRTGPLDASLETYAAAVFDDAGEDAGPSSPGTAAAGDRIGPYRVLSEIGRGGMGVVLLAERTEGDFEQQVAIKVVRGGRPDAAERFRHERRILARLRHPNIASLFDGGATASGDPWFAMEYVDGERITDSCDRRRLSVDARLELFEDVCSAVHHAHRNLVLHRDLKPGNVFVTKDGVAKLLDFGIAKVIEDEDDAGGTTRQYLTPAYAAPEQVLGEATSTATDIYSLGVLLYEILAGRNPHGDTSRSAELARNVLDRDPPSASSTVGADVAAARNTDPRTLRRRLRGDLDNVIAKAMHKIPEKRYASAEDLRADVERCRRRLPVSARSATIGYRLAMFTRRNKVGAAAIGAAILATIAGVGGIAWQARVAAKERDVARDEAARAQAVNEYLLDVFEAANPEEGVGPAVSAVALAERGLARLDDHLAAEPKLRADVARTLGRVFTKLGQYDRADSLLQQALGQFRADGRHEQVVDTLLDLSDVRHWTRDGEGMERIVREALTLAESTLPADHDAPLLARQSLGVALTTVGRFDEADSLLRENLARIRAGSEARPELEVGHLQNIATALASRGRLAAADSASREALEISRVLEPGGGPRTAEILSSLVDIVDRLDRPDDALAYGDEAIRMIEREYGPEGHPRLAVALGNYAGVMSRHGRNEEAIALRRRVLEMLVRHVGPDHGFTGQAHNNLGVSLKRAGDLDGAAAEFANAVRVGRLSFGPRHAELVILLYNQGDALRQAGRLDEAERVFFEAITVADSSGADGFRKSLALRGLARIRREQKAWAECESFNRQAWELRKAVMGEGHSSELDARIELARVVAERGRLDEARLLLDGAIAAAREGGGPVRGQLEEALKERATIARRAGEAPSTIAALEDELTRVKAPPESGGA